MHCSSCGEVISPDEGSVDDICTDCFQMISGEFIEVEDSYFIGETGAEEE